MRRSLKTIFNQPEAEELLQRLDKLTPDSQALWGKMNVAQMLAHCHIGMQVPLGEFPVRKSGLHLLGRLMKAYVLGKRNFDKNSFTPRVFRVQDERSFMHEKSAFREALEKLMQGEQAVVYHRHPVLGRMKARQWGRLHYKHIDHHFRQFNV